MQADACRVLLWRPHDHLEHAEGVAKHPTVCTELRGLLVQRLGRVGHSSFTKSCTAGGCDFGPDPGGVWTRSVVDFYLAGIADGFVKGLFTVRYSYWLEAGLTYLHNLWNLLLTFTISYTWYLLHHSQSFLYGTMRRDLLCCKPGAFVQWLAWYNLTRSHRDRPMLDQDFMLALSTKHRLPQDRRDSM